MGDLDVNLIKEFAQRPAFYDRSNLHFKDKQWNQQAWQEISHRLGYEVHLLKDRMLQLRNRYNLEKRRLENLRIENPNKPVRSPWPLFQYLKFLDSHIRPRRSYKSMMSRRTFEETFNGFTGSNMKNSDKDDYDGDDKQTEIKYETEIDSEDDRQTPNNEDNDNINIPDDDDANDNSVNNSCFPTASTTTLPAPIRGSSSGLISVRNIDTMRRDYHYSDDNHLHPPKKRRVSRFEKFEAFGKFLTISLCDLPEERALMLIEKFTTDVVKATLEAHFSKTNTQKNQTNTVAQQNEGSPEIHNLTTEDSLN